MNAENEVLKVYDEYANAIYKYCLYRVFSEEIAEDLMQETFLKFFEYLLKGNSIDHAKSFLYKTANNLVIDLTRKKKEFSFEKMVENGFEPIAKPEQNNAYDKELLLKKVNEIEDEYRIPLTMRYVDGLKPKEIADILGKSQNVISVRIHRGIEKLKKIFPTD